MYDAQELKIYNYIMLATFLDHPVKYYIMLATFLDHPVKYYIMLATFLDHPVKYYIMLATFLDHPVKYYIMLAVISGFALPVKHLYTQIHNFQFPRLISTCISGILLGIDTVGMLLQGT